MKEVKNQESDLERKRVALFFLGLLMATAIVLVAFEWKTFYQAPSLGTLQDRQGLPVETVLNAFTPLKSTPPPPPLRPIIDEFAYNDRDDLLDADLFVPDVDLPETIVEIDFRGEDIDEEPVLIADEMPEFPGGIDAMYDFLRSTLRYPRMAVDANISGKVFVSFVVDKQGNISKVKVLNSIGGGCDEEAIRVIEAMPRWKPGKQRGLPVNVSYTLPISFTLGDKR
jgi:periplasmic protein TonB